ncbi:MAG TPA: ABC transporter substrate-binding protein [Bradyrhizobium sp.]|nr:ABC transporter substrate-binding protein [Bradyrhizobium sp.]
MRRREFIVALGGAAIWPVAVRAQQQPTPLKPMILKPMPVVAFVNPSASTPFMEASVRQGLSESGYIEGQNVKAEFHWLENVDQLRTIVADLVRRQVSVIAASTVPAALAAKAATTTIPIVFQMAGDPVKLGLVASLSRPGGNITGVTQLASELVSKRVGLLHDLIPTATTIGFLVNPADPRAEAQTKEVREAAREFGLQVQVLDATSDTAVDIAFANLPGPRAAGLLVGSGILFRRQAEHLPSLEARYAMPVIYQYREYVEAGGLISYGASLTDTYRQMGVYAGRVLKGEKPADMPVMRPTKFELVINLKTAKALGLTIPPGVLAIADEVIE